MKRRISAAEFVKVYRTSNSDLEVARILGMPVNQVPNRASQYRRKGVLLPKRKRKGNQLDIEALNAGYTLED